MCGELHVEGVDPFGFELRGAVEPPVGGAPLGAKRQVGNPRRSGAVLRKTDRRVKGKARNGGLRRKVRRKARRAGKFRGKAKTPEETSLEREVDRCRSRGRHAVGPHVFLLVQTDLGRAREAGLGHGEDHLRKDDLAPLRLYARFKAFDKDGRRTADGEVPKREAFDVDG